METIQLSYEDLVQPKGWVNVFANSSGYWGEAKQEAASALSAIMAELAIQSRFCQIRLPVGEPYISWDRPTLKSWWDLVLTASAHTWGTHQPLVSVEDVLDGVKWTWRSTGTWGREVSLELTSTNALLNWDSATGRPSTFLKEVLIKHLCNDHILPLFDDWGTE
jgi:hypothetical protein